MNLYGNWLRGHGQRKPHIWRQDGTWSCWYVGSMSMSCATPAIAYAKAIGAMLNVRT